MHTVLPAPSALLLLLRKISRSPWFRLPAPSALSLPWGPQCAKVTWFSPVKAMGFSPPTLPKLLGPLLRVWLPCLGLNPSASLPLQPHFQLLLQSVTTASIPIFFQLYWAAIVSLGRVAPWHGANLLQALTQWCFNQRELPPGYILGRSHFHSPG